jgi:hypothetical protein
MNLFQQGFGEDAGFKILGCIQDVLVENILFSVCHHFIGWSVGDHEFFKIGAGEPRDLSHQLFGEPAVDKFLLFFFNQSVLKRSE